MNYRFLIHMFVTLILQSFKFSWIFSKVGLHPHEYNGSSNIVTDQFWDPQIPYVLETIATDDGETEQDHIILK